jgi:hypothetical protein
MGTGAGQIIEDADFTTIDQAGAGKPIGRLVQAGAQNILTGSGLTGIIFSAEEIDTHNFHSTAVNNTRVTPTVAGYYRVDGTVFYAANTVANEAVIRKNGSSAIPPAARGVPVTGSSVSWSTSVLIEIDGAGDYFELCTRHGSGGTLATVVSSQFASVLEWEYVRGLD